MGIVGGVIPAEDYEVLRRDGAVAVCGPGPGIPADAKGKLDILNGRLRLVEAEEG